MIVLGIDPGIETTGWGVVKSIEREKIIPVSYGAILTTSKESLIERLQSINKQLQEVINKYKPNVVAIEQLFFLKRAATVAQVGQARGAIVLTIAQNKLPLYEYNPRSVKISLTGYGSADKQQMQRMVQSALGLKEIPRPDDAADALAMAICHLNSTKYNSNALPKDALNNLYKKNRTQSDRFSEKQILEILKKRSKQ
ncbi:crossover junction endodeoxyribonuclease RuvC [Endomicrobium proavitum]|uniref:Crossover junction endodeoxyribonuclease RuvC n=1 Tax=Endomicrobium proavitum TaxID=1408281 RepID=A0A0G3WKB8_9BACT|nr:crossover junction endodeoxyribonuclease RuvC [Endomicrobium proavitum]AKL97939.1 Crossover junction endodeoxyribonuclease RuvC [Endomicrobium proavitum]